MHWLLYVLVLATTITGWLFASFRGWSMSLFFLMPLPMLARDNAAAGKAIDGWHQAMEWSAAGGDRHPCRGGAGPHLRLPRPHHAADAARIALISIRNGRLLQTASERRIIRRKSRNAGETPWQNRNGASKTATELSAALKAKKVSAVELAQDVIGRIERHDAKINAVCVRDFTRGLEAARAADAARARGETRPLLGLPMTVKESYNVGGLPTTWGFPAQKDFVAAGRRAVDIAGEGGRRRHPRQDQRAARARRLAELQRHLRHHQQSVRSRPHAGRLLRRIVGGAGGGLRAALARFRYRRLAAGAGVSLRRLCPQADLRPGAVARPYAAAVAAAAVRPRSRGDRADGALGRRSFAAARRDRRAGPARSRQGLSARAAAAAPRRAEASFACC